MLYYRYVFNVFKTVQASCFWQCKTTLTTEDRTKWDTGGQTTLTTDERTKWDRGGQIILTAEDRTKWDIGGQTTLTTDDMTKWDTGGGADNPDNWRQDEVGQRGADNPDVTAGGRWQLLFIITRNLSTQKEKHQMINLSSRVVSLRVLSSQTLSPSLFCHSLSLYYL